MVRLKNTPIKVYLRQEQLGPLRTLAQKRGVSLSEIIRQGVDCLLAETLIEDDPLWSIVGLGSSDVGDLAVEHDRYLAEMELEDNLSSLLIKKR